MDIENILLSKIQVIHTLSTKEKYIFVLNSSTKSCKILMFTKQSWDLNRKRSCFFLCSGFGVPAFSKSCMFLWRRQWHPTPVLLPGKSHGWRGLVGCTPWGREESDMTERLHFHFSLSCTGKGNGNLLQCSCLENPRDGGPWWAAIYGVAQSRTRLKRLSSSSSSIQECFFFFTKKWILLIFKNFAYPVVES